MRHKFEGMKMLNNIPAKMLLTDQIYDGQSDSQSDGQGDDGQVQDSLESVSEQIDSVSN